MVRTQTHGSSSNIVTITFLGSLDDWVEIKNGSKM